VRPFPPWPLLRACALSESPVAPGILLTRNVLLTRETSRLRKSFARLRMIPLLAQDFLLCRLALPREDGQVREIDEVALVKVAFL